MLKKILILIILLFIMGCQKIPTELGTGTVWQFTGGLIVCGKYDWIYDNPYPISRSDTAIIGDYRIVTEKNDRKVKYSFLGCNENTCNGNYKEKDEYGCDVWYGITSTLECGLDHAYQCSCNTEPDMKQCGDRQVECRKSPCGCPMIMQTFNCYGNCGGANLQIEDGGDGCSSKHKIYFKDELIETVDWDWQRFVKTYEFEGQKLEVFLQSDSQYYPSNGRRTCPDYTDGLYISKGCKSIENRYAITIPEDLITLEYSEPTYKDSLKVQLKINNGWEEIYANLTTKINDREFSSFETIEKGENVIEYSLDEKVGKIIISSDLNILSETDDYSGINYFCYENKYTDRADISTCQYIRLGQAGANAELNVTILCDVGDDCDDNDRCTIDKCENNKCVFEEKQCEEGKTCNRDNGKCEKKSNLWWWIGGILVVLIGSLAVFFRKKIFQ